jgi:hypothetical protein
VPAWHCILLADRKGCVSVCISCRWLLLLLHVLLLLKHLLLEQG